METESSERNRSLTVKSYVRHTTRHESLKMGYVWQSKFLLLLHLILLQFLSEVFLQKRQITESKRLKRKKRIFLSSSFLHLFSSFLLENSSTTLFGVAIFNICYDVPENALPEKLMGHSVQMVFFFLAQPTAENLHVWVLKPCVYTKTHTKECPVKVGG